MITDQPAGGDLLLERLGRRTQQWLADLLNVSQSTVSLWGRKLSTPEPVHRRALAILLGIPEESWFTDEEREFLKKIEAVAFAAKKRHRTPAAKMAVLAGSPKPSARTKARKAA
jgi:transcriptional regulator with XRE-family HTH domain